MKKHFGLLSQYLIGLLFGWGLIISGMSNPQKVLGFLDLAGAWDPSLIFVMLGAILVGLGGFFIASKRSGAFFGGALHIPSRKDITKPLIIGSFIFGIGWGIAGICPGPALVSVGAGYLKAFVFVIAMLVGMGFCEKYCTGHRQKRSDTNSHLKSNNVNQNLIYKEKQMSLPITCHNDQFGTLGQIDPSHLSEIAKQGYKSVINNRPDGEGGLDQPKNAEIQAEAEKLGLQYAYLPVVSGAITPDQVIEMARLLKTMPGPILAFCRSGARSTNLYQLALQIK